MSNNTITSIRIDSDLFEKIKMYSEIEGCTQTDFINDLVSDAFERYTLLRSGGAVLTLPNPQNYSIDSDKANDVLKMLSICQRQMVDSDFILAQPLTKILAFYTDRLLVDSDSVKERFRSNVRMDT